MVEQDRFERQFGAGWLSAYRYARDGNVPLESICDKLVSALSKTLRESGGIPAFDEITHILTAGRGLDLIAAFGALDDLRELENGHLHTKIGVEVAKSLRVQWEATDWNMATAAVPGRFAEALCSALVERNYFAKARHPLLAEGSFESYEQMTGWQSRVEEILRPQLSRIADQIGQKPDARGLRAPNRLTKKERTGDLLAENLLVVKPSNSSTASRSR